MSRLADIVENHERLDELTGLFKHHGVNAEFVAEALVNRLERDAGTSGDPSTETVGLKELLEDLQQFRARF